MSINVITAVREGIVLEAAKAPLAFPATVASAIAATYKQAVASEPVAEVSMEASYGRPHPLMNLLGIKPDSFQMDFKVYKCGNIVDTADGIEKVLEIFVAEHEGLTLLAFCPEEVRKGTAKLDGIMATFAFESSDLDELLSLLATDFSELPSQDDVEAEGEQEE